MARQGTYYLGRVVKLGQLDQEKLIFALTHPSQVTSRGGVWTLVDIEHSERPHYIFGRLARYLPEGRVDVVDPVTQSTESQIEPNLLVASTPFVYIPEHSGIAFLATSAPIDILTFVKRFTEIIERSLENFFVHCEISFITDIRAFALRLASLDRIFKIQARVYPPNPLFGPLWERLKEYLISRNTDQLVISEDAGSGQSLNTILQELAGQIAETNVYPRYFTDDPVPIGDAAILMAADGYGRGTVRGSHDGRLTIIRTTETIANFHFNREPTSHELYEAANEAFELIKRDRYMEHGS